ncbi:MAG: ribosomal protein S18-alanine N-acetyltransferase [Gemmatimonadaceae bacterium]
MRDEARASAAGEPGGFVLRHADAGDVAGIERIERASFSDPWSQDDFISVMSAPQTIFLVAADQRGGIGGYVLVMVVIDESEILNIAVDPAVRGASLGGSLLDAGMTEARSRGAKEIFLEVRESNEAALRLYSSRGFEAVSRRRKYYRTPVEDALVLRRAMQ